MRQQPVQTGNAGVADPLDPVAHDFGGHGRFLGHRQVTRAGANDGDGAGPFRQRPFLDGHTTGDGVVNRLLEFFAQRPGLFGRDAGDQHPLFLGQDVRGDFNRLIRRFTGTKNHFGKTLAQGAMCVHLGKAKIGQRRGLKGAEHLPATRTASPESFQQLNRFARGHLRLMIYDL